MSFMAETGSGHAVMMDGHLKPVGAISLHAPWK
jgi:hypothetical protein